MTIVRKHVQSNSICRVTCRYAVLLILSYTSVRKDFLCLFACCFPSHPIFSLPFTHVETILVLSEFHLCMVFTTEVVKVSLSWQSCSKMDPLFKSHIRKICDIFTFNIRCLKKKQSLPVYVGLCARIRKTLWLPVRKWKFEMTFKDSYLLV